MRRKKSSSGNLKFASLFTVLVIGLVLLSLLLRIFIIVGKSKFDGENSIIVLAKSPFSKEAINFSPKNSSISILNFKNDPSDIRKIYEVPIDGEFISKEEINSRNISSILFSQILNFGNQNNLNFMDFLRLSLFTNTVKSSIIDEEEITNSSDLSSVAKLTSSLFIDPQIVSEKLNIEIINSTNMTGLGNRVANMISNLGGNVILVTTGNSEDSSRIEYASSSYTSKRLAKLLNFKEVKTNKKGIPDITVIIGNDSLNILKY